MEFIEPNIELVLGCLKKLKEDTAPNWGTITARGMVEHLTDSLQMAYGFKHHEIEVPEKYWSKMRDILDAETLLPKNYSATFAPKIRSIRNETLPLALGEFKKEWFSYQNAFNESPEMITNHPNYGPLNRMQWNRLLSKHLTHHFKQFSLL